MIHVAPRGILSGICLLTAVAIGINQAEPPTVDDWLAKISDLATVGLIARSKTSVIPVTCRDSTWPGNEERAGTAFLLGARDSLELRVCALTCAHVVIDTTIDTTLVRKSQVLSQIRIRANRRLGGTSSVIMKVVHVNRRLDFAVLVPDPAVYPPGLSSLAALDITYTQPSLWTTSQALAEGQPVYYLGYPMGMGVGIRNHPVVRTGVVAQISDEANYILVDGFVQHGHSGSPVFTIEGKTDDNGMVWSGHLVGIARAYPPEVIDALQGTGAPPGSSLIVAYNPGFTVVTPMDSIAPVLRKVLGVP